MTRLIVLTLALTACAGTSTETPTEEPAPATEEVVTYACPMHPEVTSTDAEEPCSICGMDLVAQEAHDHSAHGH